MKTLKLSKGLFAHVNDDIFDLVSSINWSASRDGHTFYARGSFTKEGKRFHVSLHHIVIGVPLNKKVVDHIDGNGLNDVRENLRIVSRRENQWNRSSHRAGKIPGVRVRKGKWVAEIRIDKKLKWLGSFATQEEARIAYDNSLP